MDDTIAAMALRKLPLTKYWLVTGVTSLRIVVAILAAFAAQQQAWAWVLWLIILGFVSDYADGWLARRLQAKTDFGAFFDPLADKVICLLTLAILALNVNAVYWVFLVLFALYDVTTTSLRVVLAKSRATPASWIAKWKTALLMTGLVLGLVSLQDAPAGWWAGLQYGSEAMLAVAAGLAIVSLHNYFRAFGRSATWLEYHSGVDAIDFAVWHNEYGVTCVLFDVEGTLTPWADQKVAPTVAAAIQQARKAGIKQIGLVSNIKRRDQGRIESVAAQIGADTYHIPERRSHRKPRPTMLYAAIKALQADPNHTAMVGDKLVDIMAGGRARVARAAWVDRLGDVDHPFDRLLYRHLERLVRMLIRPRS